MTDPCGHGGYCVRAPGHAGAHTACPSARTLEWDRDREAIVERHVQAAATLLALDFPTPAWADLLDDDEGA
jgi:hypothetical protein